MRVMVRWLMTVVGLLAVLSIAQLVMAADPPKVESATPGIADEIDDIRAALDGRDRGDAIRKAAQQQADSAGRDQRKPPDGKEELPAEDTQK